MKCFYVCAHIHTKSDSLHMKREDSAGEVQRKEMWTSKLREERNQGWWLRGEIFPVQVTVLCKHMANAIVGLPLPGPRAWRVGARSMAGAGQVFSLMACAPLCRRYLLISSLGFSPRPCLSWLLPKPRTTRV